MRRSFAERFPCVLEHFVLINPIGLNSTSAAIISWYKWLCQLLWQLMTFQLWSQLTEPPVPMTLGHYGLVRSCSFPSTTVRWHSSSGGLSLALIWPLPRLIKKHVLPLAYSKLDTNNPSRVHIHAVDLISCPFLSLCLSLSHTHTHIHTHTHSQIKCWMFLWFTVACGSNVAEVKE